MDFAAALAQLEATAARQAADAASDASRRGGGGGGSKSGPTNKASDAVGDRNCHIESNNRSRYSESDSYPRRRGREGERSDYAGGTRSINDSNVGHRPAQRPRYDDSTSNRNLPMTHRAYPAPIRRDFDNDHDRLKISADRSHSEDRSRAHQSNNRGYHDSRAYSARTLRNEIDHGISIARDHPDSRQSEPPHRQLLEEMIDFGFRVVPPTPSPPCLSVNGPRKTFHLALMALTIDDLPFEHLWRAWATANSDTEISVSLLCHAKFPDRVRSSWLQQRLLVNSPRAGRGHELAAPTYLSFRPEWGSPALTRAMVALLRQAIRIGASNLSTTTLTDTTRHSSATSSAAVAIDPVENDSRFSPRRFLISSNDETTSLTAQIPPVDRFVFISESCLPVHTLEECVQLIQLSNGVIMQTPRIEPNDVVDGTIGDVERCETNDKALMSNADKQHVDPASIVKETSWINARHRYMNGTPKNKYEDDQFAGIARMILGQYRWKADQWCMLCRFHAEAVVAVDDHFWPAENKMADDRWNHHRMERLQLWNRGFGRINASDEMYFPTILAVLGFLRLEDHENCKLSSASTTTTNVARESLCDVSDPNITPQIANNGATETKEEESTRVGKIDSTKKVFSQETPTETTVTSKVNVDDTVHHLVVTTENSLCLKRPVTYTDWSEAMSSPALYTNGPRDLERIAKRARAMGCLFARKFSLANPQSARLNRSDRHPEHPNTSGNEMDNMLSGAISYEEWCRVMDKLRSEGTIN